MSVSVQSAGPRLPVTILTGFLGSGKTTLLASLLGRPEMARTAVIINELGEIGLDHELIRIGGDESAMLLSSGCVCCTIRSDLADTLRELFQKRVRGQIPDFERVVLETTGLADPAPILHTLISDPITEARYRLDGVITTIDAVHGAGQLDAHPEAMKQAAMADRILLTKTDIADPAVTAHLIERLARLNPAADPIMAVRGAVEPAAILASGFGTKGPEVAAWLAAEAERAAHEHHGHDHGHAHEHGHGLDPHRHEGGIESFSLRFDKPLQWDQVAAALDRLASFTGEKLLRVKAILDVAGNDRPVVVHGVQHLFHPPELLESWHGATPHSRIVFITRDVERSAVERTFLALLG
ncbi:MAG TPA: GTP-binding protein [Aliidongia sp.]|nr:GTP-binding protein [Aliidongia sp.]